MITCEEPNNQEEYEGLPVFDEGPTEPTCEEVLEVSLNALEGQSTPQTIKIAGYIGRKPITILIDGGSTDNFLVPKTAQRLKCALEPTQPMMVSVADGSKLTSQQQCKEFQWKMNNFLFKDEVRILPLGGCDMVLGVQLLKQLGPTVFDYEDLTLQFNCEGQEVLLQGKKQDGCPELKMISLEGLLHHITEEENGFLVVVYPLKIATVQQVIPIPQTSSCSTLEVDCPILEVQEILHNYRGVFQEPKGMPPQRTHDHGISLKSDTPFSIRPYKSSYDQKTEIEKLIGDAASWNNQA